jgi:hypothetical protein
MDEELAKQVMLKWLSDPDRWHYVDDLRLAASVRIIKSGKVPTSTAPDYYARYKQFKFMLRSLASNGTLDTIMPHMGEVLPLVQELKSLADIKLSQLMEVPKDGGAPRRRFSVRDVRCVPDSCVLTPMEVVAEDTDFVLVARKKWQWLCDGNRVRSQANPEGKLPSELEPVNNEVWYEPGMCIQTPEEIEEIRAARGWFYVEERPEQTVPSMGDELATSDQETEQLWKGGE